MTTTPDGQTHLTTLLDGPFTTEADARRSLRARHVHTGSAPSPSHDHLLRAATDAGVTLGAFDARIVAWLAHTWEATTVAVFAGLITRAHQAGRTAGATETRLHRVDLSTRS